MKTQLYLGKDYPSEKKLNSVVNCYSVKPHGGLWTSTFDKEIGSDWVRFSGDELGRDVSDYRQFLLTPSSDARIYVIDDYLDLERLMDEYTDNSSPINQIITCPDFVAISNDYDAIHLTDRGQWATRDKFFPVRRIHSLYGWDCESTLWFRLKFVEIKEIVLNI